MTNNVKKSKQFATLEIELPEWVISSIEQQYLDGSNEDGMDSVKSWITEQVVRTTLASRKSTYHLKRQYIYKER